MSIIEQQKEWLQEIAARIDPAMFKDTGRRIANMRTQARQKLTQLSMPTRKWEDWRYTHLDGLFGTHFVPVAEEFRALCAEDIDAWILPDTKAYRIVFANGQYVPQLTSFHFLPEEITIGSLQAALARDPQVLSVWFRHAVNHDQDVFTALNTALMNDGLFVHIKSDTQLDRPLEVVHLNLSVDEPLLIQPNNLIVLDKNSRAQIIEHYISSGDSTYFHNGITEIALEMNSRLEHVVLEDESRHAFHLHRRFLKQSTASHYNYFNVATGARWARQELMADFTATDSHCQTQGVYLTGDNQLCDFHLDTSHHSPDNTSQHEYKGIVYGNGRAVVDGRIFIAEEAQRSNAQLNNHNLLLSRQAEVDSKPQLEIHADDVQCSHGATVGSLDMEQLYYLRSRGISQQRAINLLCHGFAGELLQQMTNTDLKNGIMDKIAVILEQVAKRSEIL